MENFKHAVSLLKPSVMLVKVAGSLDAGTSIQLELSISPYLRKSEVKDVIVEIPDLTFISSSGLRVFMVIIKSITPKHGKLFLVGAREQVASLVRMSGMGKWITLRNSIQECEV